MNAPEIYNYLPKNPNSSLFSLIDKLIRRNSVYKNYNILFTTRTSRDYNILIDVLKQYCSCYNVGLKYYPNQEFKVLDSKIQILRPEDTYRDFIEGRLYGFIFGEKDHPLKELYLEHLNKLFIFPEDVEYLEYDEEFMVRELENFKLRRDGFERLLEIR